MQEESCPSPTCSLKKEPPPLPPSSSTAAPASTAASVGRQGSLSVALSHDEPALPTKRSSQAFQTTGAVLADALRVQGGSGGVGPGYASLGMTLGNRPQFTSMTDLRGFTHGNYSSMVDLRSAPGGTSTLNKNKAPAGSMYSVMEKTSTVWEEKPAGVKPAKSLTNVNCVQSLPHFKGDNLSPRPSSTDGMPLGASQSLYRMPFELVGDSYGMTPPAPPSSQRPVSPAPVSVTPPSSHRPVSPAPLSATVSMPVETKSHGASTAPQPLVLGQDSNDQGVHGDAIGWLPPLPLRSFAPRERTGTASRLSAAIGGKIKGISSALSKKESQGSPVALKRKTSKPYQNNEGVVSPDLPRQATTKSDSFLHQDWSESNSRRKSGFNSRRESEDKRQRQSLTLISMGGAPICFSTRGSVSSTVSDRTVRIVSSPDRRVSIVRTPDRRISIVSPYATLSSIQAALGISRASPDDQRRLSEQFGSLPSYLQGDRPSVASAGSRKSGHSYATMSMMMALAQMSDEEGSEEEDEIYERPVIGWTLEQDVAVQRTWSLTDLHSDGFEQEEAAPRRCQSEQDLRRCVILEDSFVANLFAQQDIYSRPIRPGSRGSSRRRSFAGPDSLSSTVDQERMVESKRSSQSCYSVGSGVYDLPLPSGTDLKTLLACLSRNGSEANILEFDGDEEEEGDGHEGDNDDDTNAEESQDSSGPPSGIDPTSSEDDFNCSHSSVAAGTPPIVQANPPLLQANPTVAPKQRRVLSIRRKDWHDPFTATNTISKKFPTEFKQAVRWTRPLRFRLAGKTKQGKTTNHRFSVWTLDGTSSPSTTSPPVMRKADGF